MNFSEMVRIFWFKTSSIFPDHIFDINFFLETGGLGRIICDHLEKMTYEAMSSLGISS